MSIFKADILKGKVVFVTGGGTGICYGMTETLLKAGARATIVGRRENVIKESAARLTKDTGSQCIGISANVMDADALKHAVAETITTFGRLDFVICGAAGNYLTPIDGLSTNGFKRVIEIDTIGTFNTLKATIDEVKKTQGAYIAVSATLHYKGTPLQAHVSAAKAAIDALFRVSAVEYGPYGIRFNVIAPGPIAGTEGIARLVATKGTSSLNRDSSIPLQRFGTVQEIADLGLFLFSPAASYITGVEIAVDGGEKHTSGLGPMRYFNYPDFLLEGGDYRKKIASVL